MINLLPPFQKKELETKEKINFIINIEISFLASLLSLVILFSGIYFHLLEKFKEHQTIFETKLQYLNSDLEKEITTKNKLLSDVLNFEEQKKEFCKILEKVFEILPEGIKLESAIISKEKKDEIQITLIGFSPERDKLILLRDVLQQNFVEISFPTTVWLKEKDIDFSVNFKTK